MLEFVCPAILGAPEMPPSRAEDPPPMHGAPVMGFVPVAALGPAAVPGNVPGVSGETGTSGDCGSVFWASAIMLGEIAAAPAHNAKHPHEKQIVAALRPNWLSHLLLCNTINLRLHEPFVADATTSPCNSTFLVRQDLLLRRKLRMQCKKIPQSSEDQIYCNAPIGASRQCHRACIVMAMAEG
ncbi:MAG TPA: hypothetical protein VMJ52_00135 [Xanthobacteraceae bacterium]|nr:hypothetical protein [Xanthobacteraceae bacterium]